MLPKVRDVLNRKAPRAMAAVDPIRIELVGPAAESLPSTVSVPVNAVDESAGTRDAPVCRVIYISGDDFRAADEKVNTNQHSLSVPPPSTNTAHAHTHINITEHST